VGEAEDRAKLVDTLAECKLSMEVFCKTFMPDMFFRPFCGLHRQIFKILDDDSIQMAAIAAPRGFGKTSIVNLAFPAQHILFRSKRYIVTVSATENAAVEQSENLKKELQENEVIAELFGEVKSDEFAKQGWVTSTGTKVLPRGAGQQIRGRKFRRHRPDLFLIDDLEDDEGVRSEDRREALKKWFFSSVMNSVDRGRKDWRIVVIGSVLHEDSLLANLLSDPAWTHIRLELFNDQYESNWPDFMTTEEIKALVNDYRERGLLDVLYSEFRGLPISTEDRGFKPEYFKAYTEREEELNANPSMVGVVLADPAKTHKQGSAKTAVVGMSVNKETSEIYIRDIIERQLTPDELYEEMLDMAERINALVVAPEVTSLNEYITYPLQNAINRRGRWYQMIEVKPRESKTGPRRSAGLIPLYRRGQIYHKSDVCGALERYLLMWPKPERWDVIDAVSSIIFVMEDGEVYFTPLEDELEAEEMELPEEEPAPVGWQVI